MPDNPLFPRFNKLLKQQQEALRAWQELQKLARNQPRTGRVEKYSSGNRQSAGPDTGPGGANNNWLWNSLLRKLGPLGQIIDSMLRPKGANLAPNIQAEIDAAQKLLEAFGYRVGEGGSGGTGGPQASPESPITPIIGELVKEAEGPPRPSRPGGEFDSPTTPRKRTKLNPTKPSEASPESPASEQPAEEIIGERATGLVQMIPVRSSNVHSIGYEWSDEPRRPGNLLVRFLGGTGKNRSGPGPLYRYRDVPREVFLAFQKASSKGKFLWDEVRVRGTVSGHQYDYSLIGTGDSGYVPRQAGLKRGQKGEFYLPRNFAGRRSTLPEKQVRGTRQELTKNFRANAKKIDLRAGRR